MTSLFENRPGMGHWEEDDDKHSIEDPEARRKFRRFNVDRQQEKENIEDSILEKIDKELSRTKDEEVEFADQTTEIEEDDEQEYEGRVPTPALSEMGESDEEPEFDLDDDRLPRKIGAKREARLLDSHFDEKGPKEARAELRTYKRDKKRRAA